MISDSKLLFVSPDLRPGIAAIIKSLDDEGLLDRVITTIALSESGKLDRCLSLLPFGRKAKRLLARRKINFDCRLSTYPTREMIRTGFARYGGNEILTDRVWWWAERGFDRAVAKKWAGRSEFVYGFELASAETFRAQKRAGGKTILNQVIAHHQTALALIREEMERFPDAVTEYDRHLMRSAAPVNELKDEQFAASDLIVANSDFVKQSFVNAGIAPDKIIVLPGAAPLPAPTRMHKPVTGPVIFLSAGSQSIRKGTPYLLDAWRKAEFHAEAELWLVGKNTLPSRLLADLPGKVVIKPAVSQAELFEIYSQASVLVLPSLCEGFALVILEAMAQGLPVITTENSGCGSFVEDDKNGWIVPIRDPETLSARMNWCVENKDRLAEMGEVSRTKAAAWNWDDYSALHGKTIASFVEENHSSNASSGQFARVMAEPSRA